MRALLDQQLLGEVSLESNCAASHRRQHSYAERARCGRCLTLEQEACYAAVANGALRTPDGVLTGYMHSHAAGACAGEVRVGVWFFSLIMIKRQMGGPLSRRRRTTKEHAAPRPQRRHQCARTYRSDSCTSTLPAFSHDFWTCVVAHSRASTCCSLSRGANSTPHSRSV